MSHLANVLRVATAAALMGGFTCLLTGLTTGLDAATATADPDPNNTGTSDNLNTLAHLMSKGYSLSNCTAQPIEGAQLASLTCGQSPDTSGPVQGKYILFSTTNDLTSMFKTSIKDDVLTTCGDAGQSPTPWHQGNATTNAGQVACGTYQGAAEIIWTTDAKNVLSYIRGSNTDVAALYQWWRTNG